MNSALYVNTRVELGFRNLECVFLAFYLSGGFSTIFIYF